jgi:hypothetical protein
MIRMLLNEVVLVANQRLPEANGMKEADYLEAH